MFSCASCRCFWKWTKNRQADPPTTTQPYMQQAVQNCVFWHFLLHLALSSLATCATGAFLWEQTKIVSLHFSCASLSQRHPWPSYQFIACPFLDHLWWVLTPAYCEHPTRPAILEVLWPNPFVSTIWSLLKSLRSFFSTSNTSLPYFSHLFTGATKTRSVNK